MSAIFHSNLIQKISFRNIEAFKYYPCSLLLNAYQAKIHIDNIFKDLPTCFVCEELVNSSSQKILT